MTRRQYWGAAAADLALTEGIRTKDGHDLHWATLECLAESTEFLMKNIPDPLNMSRNVLVNKFCVRDF